jgi:hypothetical protein
MSKISDTITSEAEAAEQAEAISDDHARLPERTVVTRGHNRSRVLQVRLNGDELEELERLAKARTLPVSTMARALLLSALAPADDASATITRIETDLAALKRSVAQG